jgi:hypothetical protein
MKLKALLGSFTRGVPRALSQFSILNSQFAGAALIIALTLLAPRAGASAGVVLDVRAGDGMERIATGIRAGDPRRFDAVMRLVGLRDAGAPIMVLVAPESSPLAQRMPSWVSGYAVPEESLVVVFPQRAVQYPIDGMEELLRHEVAHVLLERAAGGREVPRWFNEGVATVAGGTWSISDRSMVTLTLARRGELTFAQIETMFDDGEPAVGQAYALSGAFVNDLLQRDGSGSVAGILSRVREGSPFEYAFVRVTGRPLHRAEQEFWRRRSLWNRWIPLLTSSLVLWGAITLLATWATAARMRRDRARLEAMAAEEARIDALALSVLDDEGNRPEDEIVN